MVKFGRSTQKFFFFRKKKKQFNGRQKLSASKAQLIIVGGIKNFFKPRYASDLRCTSFNVFHLGLKHTRVLSC